MPSVSSFPEASELAAVGNHIPHTAANKKIAGTEPFALSPDALDITVISGHDDAAKTSSDKSFGDTLAPADHEPVDLSPNVSGLKSNSRNDDATHTSEEDFAHSELVLAQPAASSYVTVHTQPFASSHEGAGLSGTSGHDIAVHTQHLVLSTKAPITGHDAHMSALDDIGSETEHARKTADTGDVASETEEASFCHSDESLSREHCPSHGGAMVTSKESVPVQQEEDQSLPAEGTNTTISMVEGENLVCLPICTHLCVREGGTEGDSQACKLALMSPIQ